MSFLRTTSTGFCLSSSASMFSSCSSSWKKRSLMMTLTISIHMKNSYVSLSKSKWWCSMLVTLMCPLKYCFFWSTDIPWYSIHDVACCPSWWLRYLNGENGFVRYLMSLRCLRFRPTTLTSTTSRPWYKQNKHRTVMSPWTSVETISRAKSNVCAFWNGSTSCSSSWWSRVTLLVLRLRQTWFWDIHGYF